jgi:hypothetical protein
MKRDDVLDWMRSHRESVHGDPEQILGRAEREARHHAAEHAWLYAKRIALREAASWHECSLGSHAAEDAVAREVCHDLARELRHLEPQPDRDPVRLLESETLAALEQDAAAQMRPWIGDVAGEEEHKVWKEIVRFTHERASELIREGSMSTTSGWEDTHSYSETAERLASILALDFEQHARRVP